MTAEINQSEEASGSLNDQFSNLITAEINQSDEANGDNKQVPSLMTSKKDHKGKLLPYMTKANTRWRKGISISSCMKLPLHD
jgi:hypothetical protein